MSDTVTLSSLKLSYVSLSVRSSFLINDNGDCSRPINMVQNRLIVGQQGTHWDKTKNFIIHVKTSLSLDLKEKQIS